jgi:hypothetical protein
MIVNVVATNDHYIVQRHVLFMYMTLTYSCIVHTHIQTYIHTYREFAAGFDVEFHHLPMISAYSPSKNRYSSYKGTFSEVFTQHTRTHVQSTITG